MDNLTAQITLLNENARVANVDKDEYFIWLVNKGVPPELLLTLEPLWSKTKYVAGQAINIGKIIISKLVEFITAHPYAAIGAAIGACLGALSSMVPLIGPMLAPVLSSVGIVGGAIVGATLDYGTDNNFQALILLARDFWFLLQEVFCALKDELFGDECNG